MKQIILLSVLFLAVFTACDEEFKPDEKFTLAYKEILVARETILDSLSANSEVQKIMENYGYTEATFRKQFMEYAGEGKKFISTIDSIRSIIKTEIDEIKNKEMEKDSLSD